MQRWIVLAAGVVLQTILGGVYAWSAFIPSLTSDYDLSNGQAGLVFGVTIAVFTIVMIPAGNFLRRVGPRITATAGALLFALGYLVASFSSGSYPVILIGIGVLTGAGIGAGYVCPLTVGMKWFPNNKGLVTGVAVAGFGGGAIVLSYLAEYMLQEVGWNVLQVFRLVGFGFGGVAILASLFLREPAKEVVAGGGASEAAGRIGPHLRSRSFIFLSAGMFAGTFAGLLTVGNLKPILITSGFDTATATLGISIFAIGNAVGRIIWGQIHDRLGVRPTVLLSLACLGIAIAPLAVSMPPIYLLIAVVVAGAGFGACFVVYASSIVKRFGVELFPRLYPICFLWYGLAGIVGPGIGGKIADATGAFTMGIWLSVTIVFIALIAIAGGLPRNAGDE